MGTGGHPAGSARTIRVELPVGQLRSYLVGVLGASGVTCIMVEGSAKELRELFKVGMLAVDRAEAER